MGQLRETYWRCDVYRCDHCESMVAVGFSAPVRDGQNIGDALVFDYEDRLSPDLTAVNGGDRLCEP